MEDIGGVVARVLIKAREASRLREKADAGVGSTGISVGSDTKGGGISNSLPADGEIQFGELSESFGRQSISRDSGIERINEPSSEIPDPVLHDAAVVEPAHLSHAKEAAGWISSAAVCLVLRPGREAKIFAAVIKAVIVGVVYFDASGSIHYEPVQENRFGRRRTGYVRHCAEMNLVRAWVHKRPPGESKDAFCIPFVDDRLVTSSERNDYDHSSLPEKERVVPTSAEDHPQFRGKRPRTADDALRSGDGRQARPPAMGNRSSMEAVPAPGLALNKVAAVSSDDQLAADLIDVDPQAIGRVGRHGQRIGPHQGDHRRGRQLRADGPVQYIDDHSLAPRQMHTGIWAGDCARQRIEIDRHSLICGHLAGRDDLLDPIGAALTAQDRQRFPRVRDHGRAASAREDAADRGIGGTGNLRLRLPAFDHAEPGIPHFNPGVDIHRASEAMTQLLRLRHPLSSFGGSRCHHTLPDIDWLVQPTIA